jgi:hypothetical protein
MDPKEMTALFRKRMAQFRKIEETAESRHVRAAATEAVFNMYLAIYTYKDLAEHLEVLSAYNKKRQKELTNWADEAAKRVEESAKAAMAIEDQGWREVALKSGTAVAALMASEFESKTKLEIARIDGFQAGVRLAESSLASGVFYEDGHSREDIKDFVLFLAGLPDIFHIQDGARTIYDIATRARTEIQTSDHFVGALEHRARTAMAWCVATDWLIATIESLESQAPVTPEAISAKVEARMDALKADLNVATSNEAN